MEGHQITCCYLRGGAGASRPDGLRFEKDGSKIRACKAWNLHHLNPSESPSQSPNKFRECLLRQAAHSFHEGRVRALPKAGSIASLGCLRCTLEICLKISGWLGEVMLSTARRWSAYHRFSANLASLGWLSKLGPMIETLTSGCRRARIGISTSTCDLSKASKQGRGLKSQL